MDHLAIISSLLGFTYVAAWSASFYPQFLLNLRRRTTAGTTIAFPILNLLGFTAYSVYTGAFCFSPVIRAQYAARHPGNPIPSVSPWDFAFAAHAWIIIAATLSQFWSRLWAWDHAEGSADGETHVGTNVRKERSVGKGVWLVAVSGTVGVAVVSVLILALSKEHGRDASGWAYIDIIYSFSILKLYLTFFKYVPQAIHNARRRSTEGWSIAQILLDFTGGVASVLQLFIDAQRFAHYRRVLPPTGHANTTGRSGWADGVDGNIAKFWLGNVSMLFDILFMVQHYVLYPQKSQRALVSQSADGSLTSDEEDGALGTERQPLLGDSRSR